MKAKEIIEAYAHDYRDMAMPEEELEKMLWDFWRESEVENGFKEWYKKSVDN